jgi:DNA-binding Lrp family transcriptional regulator
MNVGKLAHLAERVRIALRAEAEVEIAERTAQEKRIDAGRALIEARPGFNQGEWLDWLKMIPIMQRTARRYIGLARSALIKPKIRKTAMDSITLAVLNKNSDISILDIKPKVDQRSPSKGRRGDHMREKYADCTAKTQRLLIDNPEITNTEIAKRSGSSTATVARERKKLVADGRIPLLRDRIKSTAGPEWKLPDLYLRKTSDMLSATTAYLCEIIVKMPEKSQEVMMNPNTDIEIGLVDGILRELGYIEEAARKLRDKFARKPRLVVSND